MGTAGRATESDLLKRLAGMTAPSEAQGEAIHGLHPYPAKYIPALPREVITEHTNERHTVLDPFCGSGTTLVEAAILGRKSVGVDSNPIATLVARAKTTALSTGQKSLLVELGESVAVARYGDVRRTKVAAFEGWEHWFQPNMARELTWLRRRIHAMTDPEARQFAFACFSGIITSTSNQDSDTRFKAVQKNLPDGYALERFCKRLGSALNAIGEVSEIDRFARNRPRVLNRDFGAITSTEIEDASVDLIVTSPPYPNSYDYYLYHKLRMRWLGFDHKDAQALEIGSRYEHSSRKAPIDVFVDRMRPVMLNLSRMLKPSKLAYLFVGDSVIAGEHIDSSELYYSMAREAGFNFVGETEYGLEAVSRSFASTRLVAGNGHGHRKFQRVLVLEGRGRNIGPTAGRTVARAVSELVPQGLESDPKDGTAVALVSADSTRHIHSLGQYPSKFIPEIPRWAINRNSRPGEVVLDPFIGSGTTAVEALIADREAISWDVSPYACLLTQAKTTRASDPAIDKATSKLMRALSGELKMRAVDRLTFDLDDFWFNLDHLTDFARIRGFIETSIDVELQPFLLAALASTIRAFGYQDEGQIKVKRDPKKVLHGTPSPTTVLQKKLPGYANRLKEFNLLASNRPSLVLNTSGVSQPSIPDESVDLIVTSPPYINAMNYPMTHRYELVLLGLIPFEGLREHQAEYIGTERVYAEQYRELRAVPSDWSAAEYLNDDLALVHASEPKRSFIAYEYFMGMRRALEENLRTLRPGGRLVMVAGTNVIRGVPINTFGVLVSMMEDLGMAPELRFHYEIYKQAFKITRHKTANIIPFDGVAVMMKP